jgi:hypothetical protein
MKKLFIGTLLGLTVALSLGIGCGGGGGGSGDDAEDETGKKLSADCNAIREACHVDDEGTGIAHDCHEIAHDGVAAVCTARKQACLAGCK